MSSNIGLGRSCLEECAQGVGLSKLDGGVVLKKGCKKEEETDPYILMDAARRVNSPWLAYPHGEAIGRKYTSCVQG